MIEHLLSAAQYVMAEADHCWLMTLSRGGRVASRPMGRLVRQPGQSEWTVSFLADSRSRKVEQIRACSTHVAVNFECDDDSFVNLAGEATVVCDPALVARRWLPAYERFFPSAEDKAKAAFIDIEAQELRLWILGLTPEPFGLRSIALCRTEGDWRFLSEGVEDEFESA
jgi:general stress protein 26